MPASSWPNPDGRRPGGSALRALTRALILTLALAMGACAAVPARAAADSPDPSADVPSRLPEAGRARFKSDIFLPLGSVLLPGFGQFFQGEGSGFAYAGIGLAGLVLYAQGLSEAAEEGLSSEDLEDPGTGFTTQSWAYREMVVGGLALQGSGLLSAYSAFRSAVPRFREEDGRYGFLGRRESAGELMAAPFRFGHLAEPSAFIPLGLLAGAVGYLVGYERTHREGADWTASADDFLFTGAEAWNAGVSEEALFRGWLFPLAYEYMGNNYWLANGAQAALFGLAHFDPRSNPVPWPQALLGFYFGWLARKNAWSLSEAVFVHAWWDMILFAGTVAATYREPEAAARFRIDLPIRW